RANYIRAFRKELKQDLKTGKVELAQIIADPPQEIQSMKIVDLLLATPKIGDHKVNRLLRTFSFSPALTIGNMTSRQRDMLCRDIFAVIRKR
ncbi:MAG: hypothetical protein ABIW84_08515, partial [Ilumatobacteraceae bacterium]